MKENKIDRITDLLKERLYRVKEEAHRQFGKSNPYRQEQVSGDDLQSLTSRLEEINARTNQMGKG